MLEEKVEKEPVIESKKKSDSTPGKKRKTVEPADDSKLSTSSSKKSRSTESKESQETPKSSSLSNPPTTPKASSNSAATVTPKTEKKFKTAFEIFVKEKRGEVEESLGGNGVDVRPFLL